MPDKEGYLKLANKVRENFNKVKFKEPLPIYIKEHYAKKELKNFIKNTYLLKRIT